MDLIWNLDIKAIVQILGYPGLFAAVFAETGVFFMFFLPGSSLRRDFLMFGHCFF